MPVSIRDLKGLQEAKMLCLNFTTDSETGICANMYGDPEKFSSLACTGCGRCIDACIGKINKNEIFMELENSN